ncbi:MAG TPA: YqiA/YcfP family alpha/beta fold hydrolase [Burkholderiaceae bacterium]|nr:YqiA/YcfP family alpha/beta fold hydrolase [Burkholderiaceae bacterium]
MIADDVENARVIVYLHGFRSSPESRKALMLRARLQQRGLTDQYLRPALSASPRTASQSVLNIVQAVPADRLALIGSSLGGYYATWAAEKLGCRAVLLNPAIDPARDLRAHTGRQPVFFSNDEIDFRPEYIDELRALDTPVTKPERYFLIAATGDALIDYKTMVAKYRGARQHVIEGSNHELSDFAQYVDEVLSFCGIE